MLNRKNFGFTLIEILVVMSIMSTLSSVMITVVGAARAKARDVQRVVALRSIERAMEQYRSVNGRYPGLIMPAADGLHGFEYDLADPDGSPASCAFPSETGLKSRSLRFDNSAAGTGIDFEALGLYPKYMNVKTWADPLGGMILQSPYNCRLVMPLIEIVIGNVQHYMLHCNLEVTTDLEAKEGGTNDTLYEVIGGGDWIKVCGTYE